MGFQGLRGGDAIRFNHYSGIDSYGQPNFRARVAKVQPLLTFPDHVVVNLGGRHGTPYVVDSSNYLGRA